ncbi:MAG: gamma-glutamylcyclotransferase family protein [Terracidiphilus sp.]
MSDCLFAYGTLQPGRVPAEVAPLAAKLRPVSKGFVHGVLYDLGRYPGAVPNPSAKSKIAGTVMELPEDENMLARLDAYEGFDPLAPEASEFVRERQAVELNGGGKVECWFYRYNREPRNAPIVKDGEWGR